MYRESVGNKGVLTDSSFNLQRGFSEQVCVALVSDVAQNHQESIKTSCFRLLKKIIVIPKGVLNSVRHVIVKRHGRVKSIFTFESNGRNLGLLEVRVLAPTRLTCVLGKFEIEGRGLLTRSWILKSNDHTLFEAFPKLLGDIHVMATSGKIMEMHRSGILRPRFVASASAGVVPLSFTAENLLESYFTARINPDILWSAEEIFLVLAVAIFTRYSTQIKTV